jgi:hypothetical protein
MTFMTDSPLTFITDTFTYDSGGGFMLDVVKLGSGRCLILSEETIAMYPSWQAFLDGASPLFLRLNFENAQVNRIEQWARNRGD